MEFNKHKKTRLIMAKTGSEKKGKGEKTKIKNKTKAKARTPKYAKPSGLPF